MGSILELEGFASHYEPVRKAGWRRPAPQALGLPPQRGVGPIDLALGPGVHGLLGPNGSGKTTILKTILGFRAPTSGRGRVLGLDVATQSLEVRQRVGYMPENDAFIPGLNAAQTVRLGAELCGIPVAQAHEAADEALRAVGLGEEAFHAPNRLSTGQRQKMKLAAALVHSPELLLLDEPTNGLDAAGRRRMLELVAEVAKERGISVILSTHILPDVQAVCRSAVVLREGRLVAVEPVAAQEKVAAAKAQLWHRVDILGAVDEMRKACAAAGLAWRDDASGPLVAAAGAEPILKAARKAGVVLTRLVPETRGVEEAVLAHLEEAP